ncbi:MAG: tetratricopeptide repeat protein [Coriobacteriia bacterium]|nr:tetratricopeptide repeat protein [Coriobacteriia bacterium]MCL2749658.1 tetratricopeptide repeat protein [Coriobacteriia bacterium]
MPKRYSPKHASEPLEPAEPVELEEPKESEEPVESDEADEAVEAEEAVASEEADESDEADEADEAAEPSEPVIAVEPTETPALTAPMTLDGFPLPESIPSNTPVTLTPEEEFILATAAAKTADEAPLRKNRKPLIIAVLTVSAILLTALGFFVNSEVHQNNTYQDAMTQFEQENYELAYSGFSSLEDYRDSTFWAKLSSDFLSYEEAIALYNAGDFKEARSLFAQLSTSQIHDISEWIDKCDYGIADKLYKNGNLEEAAEAFEKLGDFSDSKERAAQCRYNLADELFKEGEREEAYFAFIELAGFKDSEARAAACLAPLPESGILYQDPESYFDFCAIRIDYRYSSGASYYKIYSDERLVATVFLHANTSVRIYLLPGNYSIKEGGGNLWFGEDLAFGSTGWYSTLLFANGTTDTITLDVDELVTITINATSTGNVSSKPEDPSSF